MWEEAAYEPRDDREPFAAIERLIGADGVVTRSGTVDDSAAAGSRHGTENFYFLLPITRPRWTA